MFYGTLSNGIPPTTTHYRNVNSAQSRRGSYVLNQKQNTNTPLIGLQQLGSVKQNPMYVQKVLHSPVQQNQGIPVSYLTSPLKQSQRQSTKKTMLYYPSHLKNRVSQTGSSQQHQQPIIGRMASDGFQSQTNNLSLTQDNHAQSALGSAVEHNNRNMTNLTYQSLRSTTQIASLPKRFNEHRLYGQSSYLQSINHSIPQGQSGQFGPNYRGAAQRHNHYQDPENTDRQILPTPRTQQSQHLHMKRDATAVHSNMVHFNEGKSYYDLSYSQVQSSQSASPIVKTVSQHLPAQQRTSYLSKRGTTTQHSQYLAQRLATEMSYPHRKIPKSNSKSQHQHQPRNSLARTSEAKDSVNDVGPTNESSDVKEKHDPSTCPRCILRAQTDREISTTPVSTNVVETKKSLGKTEVTESAVLDKADVHVGILGCGCALNECNCRGVGNRVRNCSCISISSCRHKDADIIIETSTTRMEIGKRNSDKWDWVNETAVNNSRRRSRTRTRSRTRSRSCKCAPQPCTCTKVKMRVRNCSCISLSKCHHAINVRTISPVGYTEEDRVENESVTISFNEGICHCTPGPCLCGTTSSPILQSQDILVDSSPQHVPESQKNTSYVGDGDSNKVNRIDCQNKLTENTVNLVSNEDYSVVPANTSPIARNQYLSNEMSVSQQRQRQVSFNDNVNSEFFEDIEPEHPHKSNWSENVTSRVSSKGSSPGQCCLPPKQGQSQHESMIVNVIINRRISRESAGEIEEASAVRQTTKDDHSAPENDETLGYQVPSLQSANNSHNVSPIGEQEISRKLEGSNGKDHSSSSFIPERSLPRTSEIDGVLLNENNNREEVSSDGDSYPKRLGDTCCEDGRNPSKIVHPCEQTSDHVNAVKSSGSTSEKIVLSVNKTRVDSHSNTSRSDLNHQVSLKSSGNASSLGYRITRNTYEEVESQSHSNSVGDSSKSSGPSSRDKNSFTPSVTTSNSPVNKSLSGEQVISNNENIDEDPSSSVCAGKEPSAHTESETDNSPLTVSASKTITGDSHTVTSHSASSTCSGKTSKESQCDKSDFTESESSNSPDSQTTSKSLSDQSDPSKSKESIKFSATQSNAASYTTSLQSGIESATDPQELENTQGYQPTQDLRAPAICQGTQGVIPSGASNTSYDLSYPSLNYQAAEVITVEPDLPNQSHHEYSPEQNVLRQEPGETLLDANISYKVEPTTVVPAEAIEVEVGSFPTLQPINPPVFENHNLEVNTQSELQPAHKTEQTIFSPNSINTDPALAKHPTEPSMVGALKFNKSFVSVRLDDGKLPTSIPNNSTETQYKSYQHDQLTTANPSVTPYINTLQDAGRKTPSNNVKHDQEVNPQTAANVIRPGEDVSKFSQAPASMGLEIEKTVPELPEDSDHVIKFTPTLEDRETNSPDCKEDGRRVQFSGADTVLESKNLYFRDGGVADHLHHGCMYMPCAHSPSNFDAHGQALFTGHMYHDGMYAQKYCFCGKGEYCSCQMERCECDPYCECNVSLAQSGPATDCLNYSTYAESEVCICKKGHCTCNRTFSRISFRDCYSSLHTCDDHTTIYSFNSGNGRKKSALRRVFAFSFKSKKLFSLGLSKPKSYGPRLR